MSDVSQPSISAALVAALRSSPSFRAVGAVRRGRWQSPPMLPFAALSPPGVTTAQGPVMGRYTRTVVYDLQAWVASPSVDVDAQTDAAEALADELLTTLEEERLAHSSELYRLSEFSVRAVTLLAGAETLPVNACGAFFVIELQYQRRTGLSGASPP